VESASFVGKPYAPTWVQDLQNMKANNAMTDAIKYRLGPHETRGLGTYHFAHVRIIEFCQRWRWVVLALAVSQKLCNAHHSTLLPKTQNQRG
jgi:hypothetical protein